MGMIEGCSWWSAEPGPEPIADLTVGGLLDEAVAARPDGEALVVSAYDDPRLQVRWTYRDLDEQVNILARALLTLGVLPGQSVALWGPNLPHWVVAELAVARIGAVLVPLNPTYRRDEARYALEQSAAVSCLVLPGYSHIDLAEELRHARAGLETLRYVLTLGAPVDGLPGLSDLPELAARTPAAELDRRAAAVRAGDPVQIQFTSGTTGRPKGAVLTHRNIANNARQTAQRWQVRAGDRWCNPLPLFHTAGCGTVALGTISVHATHLPLVRFEADLVLRTIARERCTVLETVPTILTALVERQRSVGADVSSLRLIGTSGAPTPDWLGRACANDWGAPLRVLYGSTEVSPTVTGTAPSDDEEHAWITVGKPLPWLEVRIVDPVSRAVVPVGSPGEIEVFGYSVMAGYHNRPADTAAVLSDDGWFAMGDLGTLDADGYLRIVGRLKDVIIRGGENLYPAEIEELIREHPAVLDVAVVGVPDHFFGEEACAVVTLEQGHTLEADALRAWLRERVTHQKAPRYLRIVDSLPQTASGKVQKFRLREQLSQELSGMENV